MIASDPGSPFGLVLLRLPILFGEAVQSIHDRLRDGIVVVFLPVSTREALAFVALSTRSRGDERGHTAFPVSGCLCKTLPHPAT
jgi:hypothetical protein